MGNIKNKFWKGYFDGDLIRRLKLLEKIAHKIDDLKAIKDKELRIHSLTTALNGYFEDLIEFMETREED